jgi:hypothetical protein
MPIDHEALELLRAQLDAQADAVADRIDMVAEAIAFAKEAVRRARRVRARAAEVRAASARARRRRGSPGDLSAIADILRRGRPCSSIKGAFRYVSPPAGIGPRVDAIAIPSPVGTGGRVGRASIPLAVDAEVLTGRKERGPATLTT